MPYLTKILEGIKYRVYKGKCLEMDFRHTNRTVFFGWASQFWYIFGHIFLFQIFLSSNSALSFILTPLASTQNQIFDQNPKIDKSSKNIQKSVKIQDVHRPFSIKHPVYYFWPHDRNLGKETYHLSLSVQFLCRKDFLIHKSLMVLCFPGEIRDCFSTPVHFDPSNSLKLHCLSELQTFQTQQPTKINELFFSLMNALTPMGLLHTGCLKLTVIASKINFGCFTKIV